MPRSGDSYVKRDIDLIREILLEVEARPASAPPTWLRIDGRDADMVDEHVLILGDAGLLKVSEVPFREVETHRLTWAGHEFLDAARDPDRWESAKRTVSEKTGALGFEVLKEFLMKLVRDAVLAGGT